MLWIAAMEEAEIYEVLNTSPEGLSEARRKSCGSSMERTASRAGKSFLLPGGLRAPL